jgi:hypothetical protein
VKNDSTVFITTYAADIFMPHVSRLDKLTVTSPSAWTTENVSNNVPPDPPVIRICVTAGDAQGYWRRRFDTSAETFDIARFDYGTNSETASYTGLPSDTFPSPSRFDSGDSGHFAYAVMPNTTDTELWLITLP